MHYGKWDIIQFIIEYLFSKNKIEIAFRLLSKDGRCPLLCLLKSNVLNINAKKDMFSKIFEKYTIPVSEEVIKNLQMRGFDDIIKKIKPFNKK